MQERSRGILLEANEVDFTRSQARTPSNIITEYLFILFGDEKSGLIDPKHLDVWLDHGFQVDIEDGPFWGLRQRSNGPCGVLAAVQAYMLMTLFFECDMGPFVQDERNPADDDQMINEIGDWFLHYTRSIYFNSNMEILYIPLLIDAICRILNKCAKSDKYIVILLDPQTPKDGDRLQNIINVQTHSVFIFDDMKNVACFLVSKYEWLQGPMGLVSLCLSALATRDKFQVRLSNNLHIQLYGDSDLDLQPFVSAYGLTTQELVNLFLCGQAVSNIFDGRQVLKEANSARVTLKGICNRSEIGFLTEMEATKYCKVGYNYKIPLYPCWVIFSNGHYTVLFATEKRVATPSFIDNALDKVETIWKMFDTGDCKILSKCYAPELLQMLGLYEHIDSLFQFIGPKEDLLLWDSFLAWYNTRISYSKRCNQLKKFHLYLYNGSMCRDRLTRIIVTQHALSFTDSKQAASALSRCMGNGFGSLHGIISTRWPNSTINFSYVD
ncbi:bifunctional Deubiquitinating enzyme MINDY-3-4 [Babesia duncani]|uniref:Bifunctional Deubiquitinating enzyme MINDY-3-4 n=1 Tax=Babesia duncani TaxID=323732 RepID=A0AAD9PKQ6_9APIC|nr:bifunctional Deubiquitinating enzyme MINDY-3-4 [Babesia duncani]